MSSSVTCVMSKYNDSTNVRTFYQLSKVRKLSFTFSFIDPSLKVQLRQWSSLSDHHKLDSEVQNDGRDVV